MIKKLMWGLLGLAFLTMAIFGSIRFAQYRERDAAIQAARPDVKLASIYLSEIISINQQSGQIVVSEFERKTDDAVADIESKIIPLKMLEVGGNRDAIESALSFMQVTQDTIRIAADTRRHMMLGNYETALIARGGPASAVDHVIKAVNQLKAVKILAIRERALLLTLQKLSPDVVAIFGIDAVISTAELDSLMKGAQAMVDATAQYPL